MARAPAVDHFGYMVVRGEKIPSHLHHELSLWGASEGHDALNNADLALAWLPAIPTAASGPEFVSLDQLIHPLVLRALPICRGHPYSSTAQEAGDSLPPIVPAPWSWSRSFPFWLPGRQLRQVTPWIDRPAIALPKFLTEFFEVGPVLGGGAYTEVLPGHVVFSKGTHRKFVASCVVVSLVHEKSPSPSECVRLRAATCIVCPILQGPSRLESEPVRAMGRVVPWGEPLN